MDTFTGPPSLDYETFIAVTWGSAALSFPFVAFRVFVRIRTFKRLSPDDFCVIVAWLLLISSSAVCQNIGKDMYETIDVSRGVLRPPAEFEKHEEHFTRGSAPICILYYCTLWLVKLSFLLFFARLLENVHSFVWPRRIVSMFVFASWIVCIGIIPYSCLMSSFVDSYKTCFSPSAIEFQRFMLAFACSMDVLTDAMIVAIPISMLWTVRLSRKRKLALAGIFSLVVITMLFAIIRVSIVSSRSHQFEDSWLFAWSLIEEAVAIIVACLASFRSLFARNNTSQPTPPNPYERYQSEEDMRKRKRFYNVHVGLISGLSAPSTHVDTLVTGSRGIESEDVLLHPQKIYVRQDVEHQSS